MNPVLPGAMIARLTQLGTGLVSWALQHRDASLFDQEQAVLDLIRGALPDLLGELLPLTTPALTTPVAGLRQPCPQCGKRQRAQEWRRERQVATRCGVVRYARAYYYCRRCGVGWAPADQSLGVAPQQRVSAGLQTWLARVGAEEPFRQGRDLLRELTGLEVGAETVRQHSAGMGAALEAAQQQAAAVVQRTQEAAEPVQRASGMLVVETDGVMVRYRDGQWHEVKVGVVGGYGGGKLREQSYVAVRQSAGQFGPRLLAEAARRGALEVVGWHGPVNGAGLAELRPVTVLGDGAKWIWELADEQFGDSTEIVDFYHASEHLWEVAHALYGQGSAAATAWAEGCRSKLFEQGIGPVLKALWQAKPGTPAAEEALRRERGYFSTNRARMDYPHFRKQGLPIGSGAVEGSAKYVVQQRMKRPGMRWSQAGGQGILTLRAHLLSGRPVAGVRPQRVPVERPRPKKENPPDGLAAPATSPPTAA